MRLALAQIGSGTDTTGNLALIRSAFDDAAGRGADLILFPEYAMYEKKVVDGSFSTAAEPVDGPFASAVAALAREHGIAAIAGMVEAHPNGERPFNTLVGFDADGSPVGRYRKINLYDSYGFRESQWISRPDPAEHVVMRLAGVSVGVMTCSDLRQPSMAAALASAGADMLAICASWVPGPQKVNHWRVLAAARAIENVIVTAAACQAPPVSIGTSLVIDPMGTVLGELGPAPGVLCVDVDPDATARERARAAT
ncbi:nitrilase-related carbon-nitrogen hydrolase [Microbacterium terrisoli]|uniref:nitrilase-related carbon-nitrogen hydrolase n=1 Tax=Microbacterium terrisoli TaxID=3242192 RepID=UPI00280603D9|nr:nitrilase-related carbon-nitrogen hydrolase [Microbacterium protaetiae]